MRRRHPKLAEFFDAPTPIQRVARAVGKSESAVSKWVTVPAEHAPKVAEALGVPVERLPVTGWGEKAA
jgi:hypothetical protein